MDRSFSGILKLVLPICFGVFLVWLFYDALCEEQKKELFSAFKEANYFWVFFSLIFGFLSHVSRAYRWKYLLEPMGYKPSFNVMYHSLMIGYVVNYLLPRAGEATRAGLLQKYEKVPFEKGFGTILAERAIDLVMLGTVVLITLGLQFDKLDIFKDAINGFGTIESCSSVNVFGIMGKIITYGIILGFVAAVAGFIFSEKLRNKIKDLAKGVFQGIFSILKSKNKLPFIGHTLFIWVMYLLFFGICFPAFSETGKIGVDGIMAGFVAGTIGIILVQGGIGVYPAFVGIILTIYLGEQGIDPTALALGWIIWCSQTAMMIVLGLISLFLLPRTKIKNGEQSPTESKG